MAAVQAGKEARYKYRKAKYSHIVIEPAEPNALTADPWSYLHGLLLSKVSSSAGNNRKNYNRAIYFSGLAEDFYKAASAVSMPAKGTLFYYGMMNLVKSFLAVNGVPLEDIVEHHGVTNTHGKRHSLSILGKIANCTNIFGEFAKLLGTPVIGKHELNLRHVLVYIPEIHAMCVDLNLIKKSKFLPVDIKLLVNDENTYIFSELKYHKGHEATIDCGKLYTGKRKVYFNDSLQDGDSVRHRSSARKRVNNDNWPRVYKNILREYKDLSICSILTRDGYKYYCQLQTSDYHHLCNSYLVMFYLGHTARYRPTEIQEVMSGELRPLATEAVALIPKQFMYHLVSLITGKLCVIPYSEI